MAPLSEKDKRTIRIAAIGISVYLALFFGIKGWRKLETQRLTYQQLVAKVLREEQDVRTYENKVLLFEKYRDAYRLEPSLLVNDTLVANAGAAIQNAARQGGLQLGPVRESPGRSAGRELATIQFDATGPLDSALRLLHEIQTLGYPVVIDSLQLAQEANKPGMLKINLSVVVLNFEAWKNEVPNA